MTDDIRNAKNDCVFCCNPARNIKILLNPIDPNIMSMNDRYCTKCLAKAPIAKWDRDRPYISKPLERFLEELDSAQLHCGVLDGHVMLPLVTLVRNLMRGYNYPALNAIFNNIPERANADIMTILLRTCYGVRDLIHNWDACNIKYTGGKIGGS